MFRVPARVKAEACLHSVPNAYLCSGYRRLTRPTGYNVTQNGLSEFPSSARVANQVSSHQ